MDDAANPARSAEPSGTGFGRSRPALLSVKINRKSFGPRERASILEDVVFDVMEGEIVAILGPSGAGKTTLLRMIAGLDVEFDGSITCRGVEVQGPDISRSLLFQDARLLPWRTVRKNVAFGLSRKQEKGGAERVDEMLNLVALTEAASAWPRELSGGMEKRAALARALVSSPDVLLLDEPFGALDLSTRLALQAELVSLRQRLGLTVVLVTHDIDEAVFLSDRIIILGDRPARPVDRIDVPLAHPRDRTAPPFEDVRLRVLASVLNTEHRQPQS